jgi:pilus assembly protein Flp/PilA
MRILAQHALRWAVWRQRSGQDLIEYALMAGFVAVSAVAVMPGYANTISQIFSKAGSVLAKANGS